MNRERRARRKNESDSFFFLLHPSNFEINLWLHCKWRESNHDLKLFYSFLKRCPSGINVNDERSLREEGLA